MRSSNPLAIEVNFFVSILCIFVFSCLMAAIILSAFHSGIQDFGYLARQMP